ncbi:MAG: DUF2269 domain-containing protein [Gemmatimonadetes bacterium]|nr:DUF2269 domain-containing protein [Gemmatimonadota bacterium]
MTLKLLLLVHVLAMIAFMGNFVAAWLLWARARAASDPAVIGQFFGVVNSGDRWLTPIPVAVILGSGFALARLHGLPIAGTGWILWSLIALGVAGLVLVGRLAGLQRELASAARGGPDPQRCRSRLASWGRWAGVGTLAVVIALILMVLKPGIPGL